MVDINTGFHPRQRSDRTLYDVGQDLSGCVKLLREMQCGLKDVTRNSVSGVRESLTRAEETLRQFEKGIDDASI